PVEPEPCRTARGVAVDSPVSVSGDGGNDGQSAPVLVVVLVGDPPAASVGNLNPRVVTGVERRPNGERPSGVTRPAVQDGVGREFGGQQDQVIRNRARSSHLYQVSANVVRLVGGARIVAFE